MVGARDPHDERAGDQRFIVPHGDWEKTPRLQAKTFVYLRHRALPGVEPHRLYHEVWGGGQLSGGAESASCGAISAPTPFGVLWVITANMLDYNEIR